MCILPVTTAKDAFLFFSFQLSVFGGSAWTWDDQRQAFYLHTFMKQQPDLNLRNTKVQKELEVSAINYR